MADQQVVRQLELRKGSVIYRNITEKADAGRFNDLICYTFEVIEDPDPQSDILKTEAIKYQGSDIDRRRHDLKKEQLTTAYFDLVQY